MSVSEVRSIIYNNNEDLAFIIGNGINRYPDEKYLSWENLLIKLRSEITQEHDFLRPFGISNTEFFNIIELENSSKGKPIKIKDRIVELIREWTPLIHHKNIMMAIEELNVPVLTTNFEDILRKTGNYADKFLSREGFTHYYPWSNYYSIKDLDNPINGFGIWHINGTIKYPQSIRLGLTDYMGSVHRTRQWLHRGKSSLFSGTGHHNWQGSKTWLHIIFNKALFIFGLGLGENETFVRWLLIERKRYFLKFPNREKKGYYLMIKKDGEDYAGKKYFLESVGIDVIELDDYQDIYERIWQ